MAKLYNFICFIPVGCWRTYTRRPHIEPLARYGKLIIVESPLTLKDMFSLAGLKAIFGNKEDRGDGNKIVIRPFVLITVKMARKIPLFGAIYFRLLNRRIARYLNHDAVKVLMLFQPYQEFYIGRFKEDIATFDYSDKFSLYPANSADRRRTIATDEYAMMRKADAVFATSYLLAKEARRINRDCRWLPNCTDAGFADSVSGQPEEIAGIKGPIVGYAGHINEWLDFDLVNYMADRNPGVNFVFVGDLDGASTAFTSSESYKASLRKPNIRYLGRKKYDDLAAYIGCFDACALYNRPGDFMRYVHPNKIYMYLATGKPVVMTDFLPESRKLFKDLVRVAHGYEDFNKAVRDALREKDMSLASKRRSHARENDNLSRAARRFAYIERIAEKI